MKACFQIPECSLSYTKIMQSECNSKLGKHSFTRLDIAEPQLILYKDNASEWKENLFSVSRAAAYLIQRYRLFFSKHFL